MLAARAPGLHGALLAAVALVILSFDHARTT